MKSRNKNAAKMIHMYSIIPLIWHPQDWTGIFWIVRQYAY